MLAGLAECCIDIFSAFTDVFIVKGRLPLKIKFVLGQSRSFVSCTDCTRFWGACGLPLKIMVAECFAI